jgi:hypothetical protein
MRSICSAYTGSILLRNDEVIFTWATEDRRSLDSVVGIATGYGLGD